MLLLVEGTCGVGKSTLRRALQAHRPLLHVGPRSTYAPLVPAEDAGTLDDRANAEHLERVVAELRALGAAHPATTLVLVETLHVTQRLRPGVLSPASFRAVDDALRELGCRTLLLHAPAAVLVDRVIAQRRGTGFARYASRFGTTEADVGNYFVREQARMRDLVARESRLPWRALATTDAPQTLARAALAFAMLT